MSDDSDRAIGLIIWLTVGVVVFVITLIVMVYLCFFRRPTPGRVIQVAAPATTAPMVSGAAPMYQGAAAMYQGAAPMHQGAAAYQTYMPQPQPEPVSCPPPGYSQAMSTGHQKPKLNTKF